MNFEKAKYFFSMSDIIIEEFMGIFYVFSFGKRGFHLDFLLLRGVCPLRDCYLRLCLVKDGYLPSFYPFEG